MGGVARGGIPPEVLRQFKPQITAKLMEHTKKLPNGCIVYTRAHTKAGYGRFGFRPTNGKPVYMYTHRLSYLLRNGEIPHGLYVLHKCDNPPCCNPEHLFIGSHHDNMKDMINKGRHATGMRKANAKLTDDDRKLIVLLYSSGRFSQSEIGKLFKVAQSQIMETWKKWKKAGGK